MKIKIKPLSSNLAWRGRKFKTQEYKDYEQEALLLLPKTIEIPDGDFCIVLEFGVSNMAFDYDNGIKLFQDILQKKYSFNDSRIQKGFISKVKTKKGSEYVYFEFFKNIVICATN